MTVPLRGERDLHTSFGRSRLIIVQSSSLQIAEAFIVCKPPVQALACAQAERLSALTQSRHMRWRLDGAPEDLHCVVNDLVHGAAPGQGASR